jgi:4-hydroxythreonine-4-phosphate dehydrogenase
LNLKIDNQDLPIGITMGDPAGISADITILSWNKRKESKIPKFVYFGNEELLHRRAKLLNLKLETKKITDIDIPFINNLDGALPVYDIPIIKEEPGKFDKKNDESIVESILIAYQKLLKNKISAIVTNPVNKKSLNYLGKKYSGQTELLSFLDQGKIPVMLLTSDVLKVVPLTRHIPVDKISKIISKDLIVNTINIVNRDLKRYFNISNPRIVVTGLNPHAGDGGLIGMEEIEIIEPAIMELKKKSIRILGPLPADSLFNKEKLQNFDVSICMYHDQALIPIKTISPFSAVNVTLGLNIIRTSPDHGTAYEIVGTGRADPQSLIQSIITAKLMVSNSANKNS